MAPLPYRSFLVNVQMYQDNLSRRSNSSSSTITATKDIFEEAYESGARRYIALSTREQRSWQLYAMEQASSATALHSTIWLPPKAYSKFYNQQVYAHYARPVALDTLLISFPKTAYPLAKQDSSELQDLSHTGYIFRTGETVDINGCRGTITMCEPVCQGLLSSTTEVVLAQQQSSNALDDMYGELSDEDDDEFAGYTTRMQFSSLLDSPTRNDKAFTNSGHHLQHSIASLPEQSRAQKQTYACSPMMRRVTPEQLHPRPKEIDDDGWYSFASVALLIELGCFSGDVIQISVDGALPAVSRTLRVYSMPSAYPDIKSHTLYLPPVLYHNAVRSHGSFDESHRISIEKSSILLKRPIAKSVTLARVPSPASNDRALQSAFFSELKLHFENMHRVVQVGDLILLGIDETLARAFSAEDPDSEMLTSFMQNTSGVRDTFGWFKVLNVEVDVNESWQSAAIVDSTNTRMVQAGVEKCRIPPISDWSDYVGLSQQAQPFREPGSPYHGLFELVNATFSKKARRAGTCATIMLHGARGSGKKTLVASVAGALGMHFLELNCYDIVGETDLKTEAYLRLRFEKAAQCAPCVFLLQNIDALAKKKDDMESGQESTMRFILADCLASISDEAGDVFPVAVIATTADKEKVPDGVLGCFRHEFELTAPSESERLAILTTLAKGAPLAPDVSVQSLAVRSAALVATDLVNIFKRAQNFAQDRMDLVSARSEGVTPLDLHIAGRWLTAQDFDDAISEARRNYSDSIGAPKIPNVTWDDVGGLASVKDDIMDTIQLPLEKPELFASGMKKRSGILFYGPPGTGKTLLAKAVATSFSLNFFSVKGPELLNMYIGESEANVRRVFQRARDAKPCVVFFDELDSVAPKRGNQGDSGGVMDRIVSQLLSELDGMAEGKDGSGGVFVIGATNRPDLLDPALLRPGRFDKMLYLGISETNEAQCNILSALTRKFKLEPSLDLKSIAELCPFTYTGADFYALCSDAMLKAMTRKAGAVDTMVKALDPPRSTQYFFDHIASKQDVEVVVSEADFRAAVSELVPSVSKSELDHYKKVRAQFSPIKHEQAGQLGVNGKAKVTDHGTQAITTNGRFQEDDGNDSELYG